MADRIGAGQQQRIVMSGVRHVPIQRLDAE
jgi:hypothetical protein